jgi:hypothetical protein
MEYVTVPQANCSRGGQSWMEQYSNLGYAVFDQLLPTEVIDPHVEAFEGILKKYDIYGRDAIKHIQPERRLEFHDAVDRLYCDPDLSLRLCRHPAMQNLTTQLFKKESVSLGPMTVIWGGGAIPHRDTLFFRDPPKEAARFWVALEDLHPESGLLYVVPGSHRGAYRYDELLDEHPEFLEILRSLSTGCTDLATWNLRMKQIFDYHHAESAAIAASYPRHILQLKKGDALLFDPGLIHGSLAPSNQSLTRRSFILECRSRNCRAYRMTAYFGAKHDFRRPENVIAEEIVESSLGPYLRRSGSERTNKLAPIVGFS